ncbi:MAG TPA: RDD family protein [Nocardioides sp.]|nr:RDD family protein [Nocardioides sp.]
MSSTTPAGAADLPVADLERRFTAYAADRVLGWGLAAGVAYAVWALAGSSGSVAVLVFVGVAVLLGAATGVLVGTTGLTPAKAALSLRVVRAADGRPIGVGPGLLRAVVLGIAGLPTLGLGAATLGWTAAMDPGRRRRGLHDRIGGAVVVDVRPRPVEASVPEQRPQQLVNLTAMRLLPTPGAPPEAAVPVLPASIPPPPAAPPAVPPAAPPAPPPSAAVGSHRADPPASVDGPTQVRRDGGPAAARWAVAFDTGERFEVLGLALVGRRPEPRPGEPVRHVVPLPSTDMSLSKTHAQFQVAPDGALVVMDRGSTNGSYVVRGGHSKSLAPGRPSTLVDGDVVRFGDRMMTVRRLDPVSG